MKHLLTWLALAMMAVGIWQHDWRMIMAGFAVAMIWPLISEPVKAVVPKCAGCTKGAFVPGCPVHDPELRKAA